MRYFLQLNYNGKNYYGWQVQPEDTSVQGEITKHLSTLLNSPVSITGCGRTDTGVHAKSFYAHFDIMDHLPDNFLIRLNKMLPSDIGTTDIFLVRENAHARFDAIDRTYKYFIHFKKEAFLEERSFLLHSYSFDLSLMNEAAEILLRYNDFKTFEKKGGGNKTSKCHVKRAEWEVMDENRWCFTITANRFLRNMVRRITGALLMTGIGTMSLADFETALDNRLDLEVKIAPPAHGLYLWAVTYPKSIYIDEQ